MVVLDVVLDDSFFFFNDTATTEIYTLSLHDALPILRQVGDDDDLVPPRQPRQPPADLPGGLPADPGVDLVEDHHRDRKSTRLNSSHANISYAVFCLKKKKTPHILPISPHFTCRVQYI